MGPLSLLLNGHSLNYESIAMIHVTKSFLPPMEEYTAYLQQIWDRVQLTNQGPLVTEFEEKMRGYLGVKYFFFLNNGTIALQVAIKALDLHGEIITTPFSYVATTSSIVWEGLTPVFVDIDPTTLTLNADLVEEAITEKTSAILATHVYGIPCAVDAIQAIAVKYGLKVIYDAAHAFGVRHDDRSLLSYGDISTLSFHATKLFHTVEGGGIATNDEKLAHRISYMRNFGHNGQEDFWGLGINGKNSELHAAMGLSNFPYISDILTTRKKLFKMYDTNFLELGVELERPSFSKKTEYNYAYYPIILENEEVLLKVKAVLNVAGIYPRRYFYPSLQSLPYITKTKPLPVASSVSARVLCLPLFHDLESTDIVRIGHLIADELNR
jgi:dTDP-4-amino-4,6-dideoxygalactose transaminase